MEICYFKIGIFIKELIKSLFYRVLNLEFNFLNSLTVSYNLIIAVSISYLSIFLPHRELFYFSSLSNILYY